MNILWNLRQLGKLQPFREVVRAIIKHLPVDVHTYDRWDAVSRPHYLCGILAAADLAKSSGINQMGFIPLSP